MTDQPDLPLTPPVPESEAAVMPQARGGFFRVRRIGFGVAAVAITLDVLTKLVILAKISSLPLAVIPGMFALTFAWNRGVSFSFLADADHPLHLFGVVIPADAWLPALWATVALVAIGVFIWWLGREPRVLGQAAIGLIIGGAAGNLLDRLVHGAVVDFLLVYWHPWYFPAFNVADMCITCGVGLLFLDALRQNGQDKNKGIQDRDDA